MGKSSFIIQLAHDFVSQGKVTWIISLEMGVTEMTERMFCYTKGINNYDLISGKFRKDIHIQKEYDDFCNETDFDSRLLMTYGIGKDFREIINTMRKTGIKPDCIILDYLQAIRMVGSEREMLTEYIRQLRQMAVEQDMSIILCSQINREAASGSDKMPYLHQLKGTGSAEELCDTALLLHWPYKYDPNEDKNHYKVICAKQRNGSTGAFSIKFLPQYYRFAERTKEDIMNEKRKTATKEVRYGL